MRNFVVSVVLATCILLGGISGLYGVAAGESYVPKDGYVPDRDTAIRVTEAILVPIYGEKQIASERPFSAQLKDGIWVVTGHLPDGWIGGVAEVKISKGTCQIISVSHGK